MLNDIGVARIFSGGAIFLTKNLVNFFSRRPLLHSQCAYASHLRAYASPISPRFFLLIQSKEAYKNFLVALGVHLLGYAYTQREAVIVQGRWRTGPHHNAKLVYKPYPDLQIQL